METKEIKKFIGNCISYHRKRLHVKQIDLAKRLNMENAYLCSIEKGHVMTSTKIIYKIADVLKMKISDIFIQDIPSIPFSNINLIHNIGKQIFILRWEKNIKQYEFAKMIKISSSFLCDIEKGRTFPPLKTIFEIADKFEIEVWRLFI